MNAKVVFLLRPRRLKTSCPYLPIARDWLFSVTKGSPERSAPAAKINGFPVIAMATEDEFSAAVIAASNSCSDLGPKVLGRV